VVVLVPYRYPGPEGKIQFSVFPFDDPYWVEVWIEDILGRIETDRKITGEPESSMLDQRTGLVARAVTTSVRTMNPAELQLR
jgi:hypothetical protein